MSKGTNLIVGELLRRASVDGAVIDVRMTVAFATNRARASSSYYIAVRMSAFASAGYIEIVDDRGYLDNWTLLTLGKWLAKYLSQTACVVNMEIANASTFGVGWAANRLTKHTEKVNASDAVAIIAAAADKELSVAAWVASERKSAVLTAATNMRKCAALVKFVKGAGPLPDSDDAPAPTPAPPAPTPAPPAPTPAPPAPTPAPPAPTPAPPAPTPAPPAPTPAPPAPTPAPPAPTPAPPAPTPAPPAPTPAPPAPTPAPPAPTPAPPAPAPAVQGWMLDLPSSTNTGLSLIVPIVVKGYSPATGNVTREMLVVYAKPTSQANAGVMVSQLGPNKQAVLVDESGQVIQSYAGFADSYFPSFTPDALMVLERAQNFVAVDIVAARASGGSYSGFDALAVQLMAALCYPLGTEYYAYQCLYPVDLNNGVDLITGTALVTHQIKSFEIVSGTNF